MFILWTRKKSFSWLACNVIYFVQGHLIARIIKFNSRHKRSFPESLSYLTVNLTIYFLNACETIQDKTQEDCLQHLIQKQLFLSEVNDWKLIFGDSGKNIDWK